MARTPLPPTTDALERALTESATVASATKGPSEAALERWSAVPLVFAKRPPARTVQGSVVFDAWSQGGVSLRDATAGHSRCLTLGAGSLLLDLVAWRDLHHWHFTARVRNEEREAHGSVLKTGRQRLLPDSNGYFQWRSRGVPRLLELWSYGRRITFDPIAWT